MPTTDAYGQGVSIAALTDAPNAATLAQNIADGLAQRGVMRFASASARAATVTSPVEGMESWLQDTNSLEVYDGSAWKAVPYGTQWTSYAVAWTATTTNPSLGNGTLVGQYMKIGTTCHIYIKLVIGSTTNAGSGTYRFSLPFTTATITNSDPGCLVAVFSRATTPNHGTGNSPLGGGWTTTDQIWFPSSTPGDENVWTNTQPWAPATTNVFRIHGTYQTAT
ncbi:hypothetical protein [Streptomyces albireticuli]|uniref:Uncharacterized protein n=1 Tax=Streptomyces albireticuli TaxID=1940 RepID=A0A2A2D3Q7_9ACTN|nr:hypothetical protein [Streptomyces albireticuli]MCD9196084.1 hypothetical protein [Streptomyces albireticuli]PAU46164.1 hypothetical protein CK936_25545 [Streptomyces albireticuli]